VLPFVLAGCQSVAPLASGSDASVEKTTLAFACNQPQASCHQGRFGVVWRQQLVDGSIQNEAISGGYVWQSGFEVDAQGEPLPFARLSLRSVLGPAVGELQRLGTVYQARMADGKMVFADGWQALFSQLFVADLPADALVAWLHNPQASDPPLLPAPWVWQAQGGRYRLVQQTDTLFARVDFIPQP
jgi:outer membrane biogenesis lipoprotein LolB